MIRQKKYKMSRKEASKTLQSIFENSEVKPNTTSFDIILLRTISNTTLVRVCKIISIIMLVLVIASPLAFRNSSELKVTGNAMTSKVTVVEHHLEDNSFTMILSGENIDYGSIYCKKLDGTVIIPSIVNAEEGRVVIPFDGDSLNIYITCKDGKVVQALLSK